MVSGFGAHLVRVSARNRPRCRSWTGFARAVAREWENERRDELAQRKLPEAPRPLHGRGRGEGTGFGGGAAAMSVAAPCAAARLGAVRRRAARRGRRVPPRLSAVAPDRRQSLRRAVESAGARRSGRAQGRAAVSRGTCASDAGAEQLRRRRAVRRWRIEIDGGLAGKAIGFADLSRCADRRAGAAGARRRVGAAGTGASLDAALRRHGQPRLHSRSCGPTPHSASSTSSPGSTTCCSCWRW